MNKRRQLDIDHAKINETLVSTILDKAIGKEITKAIASALQPKNFGTKTLIQKAVESALSDVVEAVVTEELESRREKVRTMVVEAMTDEAIRAFVEDAIYKMHFRR